MIFIANTGSRGDIQPFLLIGKTLKNQGYEIKMIVPAAFGPWMEAHDLLWLPFAPPNATPDPITDPEKSELVGKYVIEGNNSKLLRLLATDPKDIEEGLVHLIETFREANVIITGLTSAPIVACACEALGIHPKRMGVVHLTPMTATSAFPSAIMPFIPNVFGGLNKFSYWLQYHAMFFMGGSGHNINKARTQVGLKPWTSSDLRSAIDARPGFLAFSSVVIPTPDDWKSNPLIFPGTYIPQIPAPDEKLAPSLVDFIEECSLPPIYIGFGSMPVQSSPQFINLIKETVQELKTQQFIVFTGSSNPLKNNFSPDLFKDFSDGRIYTLTGAPHALLFPSCRLVIHHGGAGTTGAAFIAGVPQLICSFIADQPFWGNVVKNSGVGPGGIPFQGISSKDFIAMIKKATEGHSSELYISRAKEIGNLIDKTQESLLSFVSKLHNL
jgi:sterol 3beta-glucosyltransferase